MKSSQVAGLAGGWLVVALSMAAIGTAAVGRVGLDSSMAQVQVTVTKSVSARIPSAVSHAAQAPRSAATVPSMTVTEPPLRTVVLTEYARSVTATRTTPAAASPLTAAVAAPETSSVSSPTAIRVVAAPDIGVLEPGDSKTTTTPIESTPTKAVTTKKPAPSESPEASANPQAVSVVYSSWRRSQGAIRAGCKGAALVSVEPKAGHGYVVVEQSSWIASTIYFRGPDPLGVHVSCEGGSPTFSILH